MPRRLLAMVVLLLAVPGLAIGEEPATPAGEVLTLPEALGIALSNNPSVENAGLSVEKVGDELAAERTRQYPSFRTSVRESRNFTDEEFTIDQGQLGTVDGEPIPPRNVELETKESFTTLFEVEVRQPLLQLYGIGLTLDRLKVDQQIAGQRLRSTRQDVALEVKREYYEILKTQSELEATEESVSFYVSLVDTLTNKVRERTALEYELLEAEARLARARHTAFKERNTLASGKERLNDLMGRDITTPFTVSPVPVVVPVLLDPEGATAQALAQRPETKEARLQLERAEYQLSSKEAEYIPDLDLTANYSNTLNTSFIPDEIFFVGVVLRWEFFDWGRKQREMEKALKSIAQAKNDIRKADHKVTAEVNDRIRKLQNAQSLVEVTELSQQAAREKLRVTFNRYNEEAVLLDDLLEAESELARANSDANKATLSVWSAVAELEKALGEE